MKKIILSILIVACIQGVNLAQSHSEELRVELSEPGKSGVLKIHIHNGKIRVEGENRSDVEVGMKSYGGSDKSKYKSKSGLKRIPNAAMNIDITEYRNTVDVDADNDRTDFVIKVPKNFDLSISSHHNADIVVNGVTGDIETQSHHGSITLNEVGGSIVAETHHGSITASMTSIEQNRPMAFATHHGDIEVSYPNSLSCQAKMKSAKGDIYTDFEMDMKSNPPSKNVSSNGKTEIRMGGWIYAEIGGGGKEYMFTTYHGDIILRKN